jgi:MoaA/NifB/PqqE/SkfB family radical SAM enzyme
MGLMRIFNYVPVSLKNLLLNFESVLSETPLRKFLPLRSLYIEVTSCCNLKCRGCYRTSHEYKSKNKYMPLEDFKKYVDQSLPAGSLYLHGLGEPILHPDIIEIIEYASKSKKFNNIAFTTNALAKPPQDYEKLFLAGLTQLTISVDSSIQGEVNKMRPLTNVKKLIENIKWLLDNFSEKIKISMVVNNINLHTFEKTLEKLYEIGLREISFHPYSDLGYPDLCLSLEEKKEFLNKLENCKIDMKFYPSGFILTETPCTLSSTAPVVNVQGYLIPCCVFNDEDIFNVGNLKEKSFKELFFSKSYLEMQKNIKKGKYPGFCKGCMSNHMEVRKLIEKLSD